MTEQDIKSLKKIKDDKEIFDIIKKIIKINQQILSPDRNGMIEALRDAQSVAGNEIAHNIQQQTGFVCHKSWDSIANRELYSMLPQYKQGLINHGISKIGKGELEKMLEACIKKSDFLD